MIFESCVAVSPLAFVPKRSDAPETKLPVMVSVPPVQSTALLLENTSVPPLPKLIVAAPVRSSVLSVSANVPMSSVPLPMVIVPGREFDAPSASVPPLMIVPPV